MFQLQTQALAVGAVAITKDQALAGVVVAENPNRILRLHLQPTQQLRGRLVDSQGKPVIGRAVHAVLRVRHKPEKRELNAFYGFEVSRRKVHTDANGYYTFVGMPHGVEVLLRAETALQQADHWLGTVELKANETEPIETHTIDD